MTQRFTESVVEDAALAWLESLGYTIKHGPEIGPEEIFAERADYGQVVLAQRLRDLLLPKLISGDLRLLGTKSQIEAVV
jgi:hypothetical protein